MFLFFPRHYGIGAYLDDRDTVSELPKALSQLLTLIVADSLFNLPPD
jgi:hypothetical protein